MRVVVATEQRFVRTDDGSVYTLTAGGEYSFWTRYLSVFNEVKVLARVKSSQLSYPKKNRADGPGVSIHDLPPDLRPFDYITLGHRLRTRIARLELDGAAIILRVPGLVSSLIARRLYQRHYPYGVEVVGDPYSVFAPGTISHPMRPIIRALLTRWQKKQCANAGAAAYVTKDTLQTYYPPAPHAFHTQYSSVDLPPEAFVQQVRVFGDQLLMSAHLVSVGSMAQLYKGFDVLIEAVSSAIQKGATIYLTLVGDGRYCSQLRQLVDRLGLVDQVNFAGQLPPGKAVRAALDSADLFVLASRTEGLPRALLEAMARALPCIATDVGGVPELLPRGCIVPPNDAEALAERILELVSQPEYLSRLSRDNLVKAHEFEDRILNMRRQHFYIYVRTMTEEWLQCNSRSD